MYINFYIKPRKRVFQYGKILKSYLRFEQCFDRPLICIWLRKRRSPHFRFNFW